MSEITDLDFAKAEGQMSELSDKLTENEFLKKLSEKKDRFILDEDNNAIPADLFTWSNWIEENMERKIVKQETIDDKWISTVFMGLNYNCSWGDKSGQYEPQIFETMVFHKDSDIYCDRYGTWARALKGHEKAVEWVKNGCKDNDEKN